MMSIFLRESHQISLIRLTYVFIYNKIVTEMPYMDAGLFRLVSVLRFLKAESVAKAGDLGLTT